MTIGKQQQQQKYNNNNKNPTNSPASPEFTFLC
jgi:hypothetical protein